jgi:Xaa-Pro aminopeptidase
MLKLDYGARVEGYNSDITRTIFLGKPDEKQKEVYNTVLEAQIKAIEAMKPGVAGKDIDAIARDYITSKGYGENFGHGLGHSLGIATHDGPGLSSSSEIILEPGMVMTVEPGIYLEGWGGVRIEDDVLVTETGYEILTKARKDIVVI